MCLYTTRGRIHGHPLIPPLYYFCHNIQVITLCKVNSRKCGPEDRDSRLPDLTEANDKGLTGSPRVTGQRPTFPANDITKSN